MSCEASREHFLATVGGASANELERLFARERGAPANQLEAVSNEAKTRLLFTQFTRCDPPLRPPTHSTSGLPRRDAQRGYARLYDHLAELSAAGRLERCPSCGQFGQAVGHPNCPGIVEPSASANLTRNADATLPQRQYTYRNEAVAAEINTLPTVADSDFVRHALVAQQPETMAHAIRELLSIDDKQAARQVGARMAELVGPKVAAIARSHFPAHPDLREELVQELSMRVWQNLTDLRPTQDFITFNCPCVLNREAVTIAYRLRRTSRRERQFARSGAGADDWSEEEQLAAADHGPDSDILAEDLLAALAPRERVVAYLLARGVPISSPDPKQVTVAGVLGVTERSVRNYRHAAGRQLQAAGLAPPEWLRK